PRPFPVCSPPHIDLVPRRFDAVAFATFQGIRTQEMTGFLSFDETTLTGFVEGRDLHNPQNILFTVNFTGGGVGSISSTRSTFQVVPEPTTLALLGIGAALFGGAQRFRNRRKAKA
ncbi:MAG TPA: PEP-CTERM sorting domain-containing protein, partial [Pyrinomonadaceae bacterium]|nr:PEP-CTERM sorting domain-containing protein [Pyrinomonadaceae bacterium]